jgi:hypothetical protein
MDLGQQPRAQQLGQLASVTSIGLDSIAGLARDQRRGHHDALDTQLPDPTLQRIAARTRLVAEAHRASFGQAPHLPDHASDRRLLVGDRPLDRLHRSRHQHRRLIATLCASIPTKVVGFCMTGSFRAALVPLSQAH